MFHWFGSPDRQGPINAPALAQHGGDSPQVTQPSRCHGQTVSMDVTGRGPEDGGFIVDWVIANRLGFAVSGRLLLHFTVCNHHTVWCMVLVCTQGWKVTEYFYLSVVLQYIFEVFILLEYFHSRGLFIILLHHISKQLSFSFFLF